MRELRVRALRRATTRPAVDASPSVNLGPRVVGGGTLRPARVPELPKDVLELRDVLQEDLGVGSLRLRSVDVDHAPVDVKLHLAARLEATVEWRLALRPHELPGLVHDAKELVPEPLL